MHAPSEAAFIHRGGCRGHSTNRKSPFSSPSIAVVEMGLSFPRAVQVVVSFYQDPSITSVRCRVKSSLSLREYDSHEYLNRCCCRPPPRILLTESSRLNGKSMCSQPDCLRVSLLFFLSEQTKEALMHLQ